MKATRDPRVAGGESGSPGPGGARASAAQRPALSAPNPPRRLQRVQVRTRFRRAPELPEPAGWAWGVGEGPPSRVGHAPPRECRPLPQPRPPPKRGRRHGRARGGPRFYLLPGSRPRVGASLSPPRARPPPPQPPALKGREPGAGRARAVRAGGGGGRRVRRETRVSGPSYSGQAPRGAQGRRCAGRALEEDAEGEGIRPPCGGSPRSSVRPVSFRDSEGSLGEEPEASEVQSRG